MQGLDQVDLEDPVDMRAMQAFMKAMGEIGGPREIFSYRNLTWLPSLMESIYVVILHEETGMEIKDISRELGIAESTVSNILNADIGEVERMIEDKEHGEDHYHFAGGLAKMAYNDLDV